MSQGSVVGLDIGYSNVKMVYQEGGTKKSVIMPAGAAPTAQFSNNPGGNMAGGAAGAAKPIQVVIEGESYFAGVEPASLDSWERILGDDYIDSKPYKALFFAALATTGLSEIDHLVTGLPVNHFMDVKYRNRLGKMMEGEHRIAPKKTVTVKKVTVLPQPGGAYYHAINTIDDPEIMERIEFGRCIVIDPGFYSVDYVTFDEGAIRYGSAGTSLEAMSRILQRVADEIHKDYSTPPQIHNIEKAVRLGRGFIIHMSEKVMLEEYLRRAGYESGSTAIQKLKNTIRLDGVTADVVIIAGGGAEFYREAAKEAFNKARIFIPKEHVHAVADGYFIAGNSAL